MDQASLPGIEQIEVKLRAEPQCVAAIIALAAEAVKLGSIFGDEGDDLEVRARGVLQVAEEYVGSLSFAVDDQLRRLREGVAS